MTHTPTPAEIETLRKIVNGELDREVDYAAIIAANKTLDRLSPPAPEQPDEIERWVLKSMTAIGHQFSGSHNDAYQRTRQVLSELIASKDGERDALYGDMANRVAALRAENERLDASSENYKKLYAEYWGKAAVWHSENERLKAEIVSLREYIVTAPTEDKAAERNTAEPATDTAPVVEVTQAEDVTSAVMGAIAGFAWGEHKYAAALPIISDAIDEAEARGRREALASVRAYVEDQYNQYLYRGYLVEEIDRLMTEVK